MTEPRKPMTGTEVALLVILIIVLIFLTAKVFFFLTAIFLGYLVYLEVKKDKSP